MHLNINHNGNPPFFKDVLFLDGVGDLMAANTYPPATTPPMAAVAAKIHRQLTSLIAPKAHKKYVVPQNTDSSHLPH